MSFLPATSAAAPNPSSFVNMLTGAALAYNSISCAPPTCTTPLATWTGGVVSQATPSAFNPNPPSNVIIIGSTGATATPQFAQLLQPGTAPAPFAYASDSIPIATALGCPVTG